MSKITRAVALMVGLALCIGAGPGGDVPVLPPGVVYKPASDAVNAAGIEKVKSVCSAQVSDDQIAAVFGTRVICGPGLWREVQGDPAMAAVGKGDVKVIVPITGGPRKGQSYEMHGKLFQSRGDVLAFWHVVARRADFAHVSIRKLTTAELKLYWAMISFDIEEPVFAADCGRQSLLFQFVGPNNLIVLWTDDLANYHWDAATKPAASAPSKR